MPNYTGHINKWKERANIDFFTEFVKAWIPFNAWMSKNYDLPSDREIINEIKHDSYIKTKIKHLLENNDEESNDFKNHLSRFHRMLEELELKNNGNYVNFTNIVVEKNKKEIEEFDRRGLQYKALYSKLEKKFIAVITGLKGDEIFKSVKDTYSYEKFCEVIAGTKLSETQKDSIKSAYKGINPFLPENLMITDDNDCIKIGNYKFCPDRDKIFKAIIENIYALRCLLFHGDIEPNNDTNELFESAYFVLKYMLKAIS